MLSIRKIGALTRTYRHLNRYRRILAVLFKYGFGDLVELLRIDQYLEVGLQLIARKRRERIDRLPRAERVRLAIEELGPTFIKLGQVLSTRPDLVPVEFIREFAKLQDKVPSYPFEEAQTILTQELGAPPGDLFTSIEQQPLASASIGQVHRATLSDGETVAVKVQRPGIKKVIEIDLEIMLHLATLMERHIEELALHRPVKIVEEFTRTLEKEIDYTIEASNMEQIATQFLDDPTVYIPKVFRDHSTSRVLTTEFIESGIKVSQIEALDKAGLDRKLITARGADIYLRQIFDVGFFHADPHPGNIFILPGNVVCLLDFGMVGRVDRRTREIFVDLVDAVVRKDESRAAKFLLQLTDWEIEPDMRNLERDVADFMGMHLYKPIKDVAIAPLLNQILELATRYRLAIPPDIFLMIKALGTVEGVARDLDPDFDMVKQTAPFIKRIMLERYSPERLTGDTLQLLAELRGFVGQFPRDLLEVLRLLRQRKLQFNVADPDLHRTLSTADQISNRLAFSVIIAALIVGSALIVISKIPPLLYGISIIGIIGFFAAAIMGIWLLVAILRRGRL
jgi:ubiquinone biosynthesis protein